MNSSQLKELQSVPRMGKRLVQDLMNIGITKISYIENKNPQALYRRSNNGGGTIRDRSLLSAFRCAVDFDSLQKQEGKKKPKRWLRKD